MATGVLRAEFDTHADGIGYALFESSSDRFRRFVVRGPRFLPERD